MLPFTPSSILALVDSHDEVFLRGKKTLHITKGNNYYLVMITKKKKMTYRFSTREQVISLLRTEAKDKSYICFHTGFR